jgi:hypothetical protein
MDRRGVGEEFFLDGVTVEPATGHSLRSQRGKDPLPAGSGAPGTAIAGRICQRAV